MQQPHWHGCAVQRGEEEDWELPLDTDILVPMQMPFV